MDFSRKTQLNTIAGQRELNMAESKVYGVVRIEKIKCSNGGGLSRRIQHNIRESIADNVDQKRTPQNEYYGATTRAEIISRIHERWKLADMRRKDSVGALEVLVTTTGKLPKGDEKDFLEDAISQLKNMYGEDNLIGYYIHKDEKETHVHAFVVPLETKKIEKTRLSNEDQKELKKYLLENKIDYMTPPKKPGKDGSAGDWEEYKRNKFKYEKYKQKIKPFLEQIGASEEKKILSVQKYCDGQKALSKFQDEWHKKVFAKYGLDRGEKAEHKKTYSPTKLHKWQEKIEQKEAEQKLKEKELEQREADLVSNAIKMYEQEMTSTERYTQIKNIEPERKESAKAFKLRLIGGIDALYERLNEEHREVSEAKKHFEKHYKTQYEKWIKDAESRIDQNTKNIAEQNITLKMQNKQLQTDLAERTSQLNTWLNMTPQELRKKAEMRENRLNRPKNVGITRS